MWLLENDDLPSVIGPEPSGAPLFITDVGTSAAPLFEVDFQAAYQQPGLNPGFVPETELAVVPAYTGTSVTITVNDLDRINTISSGGVTFTPAVDPTNPQPGEFTFNPETNEATIYPSEEYPLNEGFGAEAEGGAAGAIPTDYIDPAIIAELYGLPVTGKISWTQNAEQHPSGGLELECFEDAIALLRQRFTKGREFTIAGIPLAVSNFKESQLNTEEYPGGFYKVTISLGGKWERDKYNEPVFLRPEAAKSGATSLEDPDCLISGSGAGDFSGRTVPRKVAINELAKQNGATFVAQINTFSTTANQVGPWEVAIPRDTARTATVQWLDEVAQRLAHNGCFIDFNDPTAVMARSLEAVASWDYPVKEIEIDYQGGCDRAADHVGYGAEYRNSLLQGDFLESGKAIRQEDFQGGSAESLAPKWKQRQPLRLTLECSDEDVTLPPDFSTLLTTLSNTHDISGKTKTQTLITTEDGFEVRRIERIYGWEYTAKQIANSDGLLRGLPIPYWRMIQEKITEPIVDEETGLVLGNTTRGFRRVRFKQESDEELETVRFSEDATDAPFLALYQYRDCPIISETRFGLETLRSHYKDADDLTSSYETYKICNRDGSSSLAAKKNPLFLPGFFVKLSWEYTSSFMSTPNPDSTTEEPLPDLTVGEETENRTEIFIVPTKNTKITSSLTGNFDPTADQVSAITKVKEANPQEDLYIERRSEFSARGPNFREQDVRETFEVKVGRPSPATRRPPLLEREEPEANNGRPQAKIKSDYRLTTNGWDLTSPPGDEQGYPLARNLDEALLGAKTDLKKADIQSSVRYSYTVPFNPYLRPLDRVATRIGVNFYRTRAVTIANEVNIDGVIDGMPILTCSENTKVTAGIDRDVVKDLGFTPNKVPRAGSEVQPLNVFVVVQNIRLGQFWNPNIRTRRNPNGTAA